MHYLRGLPFPIAGCLIALATGGCLSGSPWAGGLPCVQINVVMPGAASPGPSTPAGPTRDDGRCPAKAPSTSETEVPGSSATTPPAKASAESAPASADDSEKNRDAAAKVPAPTKADLSQLDREENDKPAIRLRGRIHTDAIEVTQSLRDKMIFGNIQNAVGFRRARLGAEGEVGEQVNWVAE